MGLVNRNDNLGEIEFDVLAEINSTYLFVNVHTYYIIVDMAVYYQYFCLKILNQYVVKKG